MEPRVGCDTESLSSRRAVGTMIYSIWLRLLEVVFVLRGAVGVGKETVILVRNMILIRTELRMWVINIVVVMMMIIIVGYIVDVIVVIDAAAGLRRASERWGGGKCS